MKSTRSFADLTGHDIDEMIQRAENAVADYAQEINSGGLSHAGLFSVYTATQEAILTEHSRAYFAYKGKKKHDPTD